MWLWRRAVAGLADVGCLYVAVAGGGGRICEIVVDDMLLSFTPYKDGGCRDTIDSTNVFGCNGWGFGFLIGSSGCWISSTGLDLGDNIGNDCFLGPGEVGFAGIGVCFMGSAASRFTSGGGSLIVLNPSSRGSRLTGVAGSTGFAGSTGLVASTGRGISATVVVLRGKGNGGATLSLGSSCLGAGVGVFSTGLLDLEPSNVGEGSVSGIEDLELRFGGRVFLGNGFMG